MSVEFKDLIAFVTGIAWPVVTAVALLKFHKPLSRFVEELGKRATKLSAFDVSIEIATVPSPPDPWEEDTTKYQGSNFIGNAVYATSIEVLFQRVRDDTIWHYLIVDIKKGDHWLISRLFLFTVILRYMGGLRCVVFVETKDELSGRLLGIAHPEKVRFVLAQRYPWFDQALDKPWSEQHIPILSEPLFKDKAVSIIKAFIMDNRIQLNQDPQNNDEWLQLGNQNVWEHTRWLDIQCINEELRGVFYDRDNSQFVDSPETTVSERKKALLRRQAPFVALVNDKGEFKGLVDRQDLLVPTVRNSFDNLHKQGFANIGPSKGFCQGFIKKRNKRLNTLIQCLN